MTDQWVMGLIGIGLIIWGSYAIYHYMCIPRAMENVYLSDRFPQASQAVTLLKEKGYDVIGGEYYVPIHTYMDGKELERTKMWIDMIARRDEQWYIVRIARKQTQLEWDAKTIHKQWATYFAAYPKCAGLLVVNMKEKCIRELQMKFGEGR